MPVYLLRVQDTHEAVGIFWGDSIAQIWDGVDEHCDPGQCEYIVLKHGGIFFPDGAPALPLPEATEDDTEDDEVALFTRGVSIGELVSEALSGRQKGGRKKMPCADEPGGLLHRIRKQLVADGRDPASLAPDAMVASRLGLVLSTDMPEK